MNIKEFNEYRFSCNTKVKFQNEWYKVESVDFERGDIEMKIGIVHFSRVEDIKEEPSLCQTH